MSVRRTVVIGAVIVVLVFLLYSWFFSSEEDSTKQRWQDQQDTERLTKLVRIQELLENRAKKEDDLEDRLGKIESSLKKMLLLKEEPKNVDAGEQNDNGAQTEKIERLSKLVEAEFERWAEKQEDFLLKIDEEVKGIIEEMEKSKEEAPKQGHKQVEPNDVVNPDDIDKSKDSGDAQDEIDKLYDQIADEEKEKAKTKPDADTPEEVEAVDSNDRPSSDPGISKQEDEDNVDPVATDRDTGTDPDDKEDVTTRDDTNPADDPDTVKADDEPDKGDL